MRGFRLGPAQGTAVATDECWERRARRLRCAPSVVTEYENLAVRVLPPTASRADYDWHEYQLHKAQVEAIKGLHREGWAPIDWRGIQMSAPAQQPARPQFRENQAAQELGAFRPTIWERLFGSEKRRAVLEHAIVAARDADESSYREALSVYQAELEHLAWLQHLARGVLAGEGGACQYALDQLGPFQNMPRLGSALNIVITRSWCVEAWLTGNSNAVVPVSTINVTPSGKLSRKDMPNGRYWELYQDHICSAALRVAREVFAVLAVPFALVHVGALFQSAQTGHPDCFPMLSVAIDLANFHSLNLDAIDPSTSMLNFEHRMDFKKSSGFQVIDLLTPGDLGIAED
jgi:hypothetical protein